MNTTHANDAYSAADVALFLDCPRCFYIARVFGIARPETHAELSLPPETQRLETDTIFSAMTRTIEGEAPLPNVHCPFCTYRQNVRATGVENDLAA